MFEGRQSFDSKKSCVSILPSASRKHFKSVLASVAISLPLVVMELESDCCQLKKLKKRCTV